MSMADAKWIWSDPDGLGRNRYVLFRGTFDLPGEPAGGQLSLFADTRYRLVVNGVVLGHGPARFFAAKPEYDTFDLAPVLRRGRNAIAVIVNSCGGVTFHSDPSLGGLIAWGEARDADGNVVQVATDESWRAMESPGHRPDTHYMSFALNQAEHLDARKMPLGWEQPDFDDSTWPPAVLHAHPEHWGPLAPRSIPLLDESRVAPQHRLGAWAARHDPNEEIHSLRVIAEGAKSLHTNARVAVMTFLHSPKAQPITFGAWWGRYWINGEELKGAPRHDVSLRQDFTARLRKGWNTFLMYERWGQDWWDFHLALPRDAGLEVSAERKLGSPNIFLIGGFWEDALAVEADRMPLPLASPADLPEALGPWRPWPRGQSADLPCRERAWKTFERLEEHGQTSLPVPPKGKGESATEWRATEEGASLALLFDFGGEVLGRPVLDFTAAAGTVVDVAYTERLKPDGTADVHHRYFVDMMERYVARDGRQTWQTFHPRGFRYLEVLVRGDLNAFDLHDVSATRAHYPVADLGSFECSDPVLTRAWELGRATLHACMEDAYLDCPWRERGLYSGDFFVEFFSNLAAFADTRLFRRCIELFFLSQGENGLIRPCPHGLPPGRHPDYSAIIVQCLWHYWARTGDEAFVREMLPGLKRLLAGIEALGFEGSDLLDGTDLNPYVDRPGPPRAGVNCGLNCFYQRAFADGSRLLDVVGETALAARYFERADRLAEAIRREFWDDGRVIFVDRLRALVPDTGPSVPAAALPLLYDIAECEQVLPTLEWLSDAVQRNFRVPEPRTHGDCLVSSYFSFYAIGALYKYGRATEAEAFMRTCWGYMLERGAWTCWEDFLGGDSLCHAWSSAPTFYLSSQVLGVEFPEPGNPDLVRIHPQPGTLQWARGVFPHPKGPIRVAWTREDDKLRIAIDCPDGIRVEES